MPDIDVPPRGRLVLGGDFWDKVRALFVHGATATFARSNATARDREQP